MKKALVITLAAMAITNTGAYANEIPGTRVAGQGAVCGEGEGKALEINATTKQESSYCFVRVVIAAPTRVITPTPTPTPTSTPTPISTPAPTTEPTTIIDAGSAAEQINTNTISAGSTTSETTTVTIDPTPTRTPAPVAPTKPETPERSNVYIADVSAKTVTVRPETDEEWERRVEFAWLNWYEELLKWLTTMFSWGWLND